MTYLFSVAILLAVAIGIFLMMKGSARLTAAAPLAALAALTAYSSYNQIPAGSVGIVYGFGDIVGQVGPGAQWVAPWRTVEPASVQTVKHTFERVGAFAKQPIDIYADISLNTRVSAERIQALYRDVGPNWFDVLVAPRVLDFFKEETVKYDAEAQALNRENIRSAVAKKLQATLLERGIDLEDLFITNIDFDPKFKDALMASQVAKQEALAEMQKVESVKAVAMQKVEQARGEADAILVRAQKQAEANRVIAQSLTPELVQYETVQRLAPNVSVMMVPTGQSFIFNTDGLAKKP